MRPNPSSSRRAKARPRDKRPTPTPSRPSPASAQRSPVFEHHDLAVVLRQISALKSHARNARSHPRTQLE